MTRLVCSFVLAAQLMAAAVALATTQPPTARDYWLHVLGGVDSGEHSAALTTSSPGTLWDNGAFDLSDGLTSERNTIITGTGGPDGNDASTIANDFVLVTVASLGEIRVCLLHDGTSAEMYIYQDGGGAPGPAVTAPLFGSPTTGHVISATFNEDTARCRSAFGFPGRQYVFNAATTGATFPTLPPGRYWLAVVGIGGSRAFWASSDLTAPPAAQASLTAVIGSTFFGFPYWTSTAVTDNKEFAFDIDARSLSTAPALSTSGLTILIAFLTIAGLGVLRLRARQN